eukprot:TRINITY_DN43454_c0_g1_i1.p1 TRINITY_DN43454_c0_g1~~TRINITY_DN43454_c0_g1_i1.p1  ORF type:complete len:101 (+),score=17.10 TRINITY_DN43454_c0_g1_i1:52-354(+)
MVGVGKPKDDGIPCHNCRSLPKAHVSGSKKIRAKVKVDRTKHKGYALGDATALTVLGLGGSSGLSSGDPSDVGHISLGPGGTGDLKWGDAESDGFGTTYS